MTRAPFVSIFVSAAGMRLPGLLILAGMLSITTPLRAKQAVEMRVTPHVASAPATVMITVTIERDANNRQLVVEAESDAYYRRSDRSLDGEDAARTHSLVFRGLPPGEYQISAALGGTRGPRAAVRTTVTVVGG
jgi:hypothetical protein